MDRTDQKRIEKAEYQAKLLQAELNAIQSSRAYQTSKRLGIVKKQITKDPLGLTKKAAKIILRNPKKVRHLLRGVNRGAFILQSGAEQTAKYQEWILLNEPDEMELDKQRSKSENFKHKPLISVITPVFNPPVDVLEELIESVLEQTYANFELCLGNFGDDKSVKSLILKYAKLDSRIKNWQFSENKGIAFNSNQILKKVSGEFVALLDHDDLLSKDALYENVKLLNEQQLDFIYSDKDKIDENGNRFEPLFKPQLSPEMLLNINYLTHLNVMRTELVNAVGGWDSDTDGAQDWDLFLKIIASSDRIAHIPKILYHWRVIASSTAFSIETKPYALTGQRKAVDKYLQARAIPATSYHLGTELLLHWEPKSIDQRPLIFVYFSNITNLLRITRYVRKVVDNPEFVVLLEHGLAGQETAIIDRTKYRVVYHHTDQLIQAIATTIPAKTNAKQDRTVMFLNDSIRVSNVAGWYSDLTGWLSIPEVGAASGRLVDRHDLIVDCGGVITTDYLYAPIFKGFPRFYQSYIGNAEWVRNLSILGGSFFTTKLSLLSEYIRSPLSQSNGNIDDYFLWLRTRAYRLVMTPHATASLYEGIQSDVYRPLPQAKAIIKKKGNDIDPYSNPNISRHDPMRLFDSELLVGIDDDKLFPATLDPYQHDATILADTFDITATQLEQNKRVTANLLPIKPKTVGWFLPAFDAVYAGLVNIFSFADYLASEQKLQTTFIILKGEADVSGERERVIEKFPNLARAKFIAMKPDAVSDLPDFDIGIATQWATAYPLARHSGVRRKCYFIQDNEANFYPKGSVSALVELTYSFGFFGIANTPGLLRNYRKDYDGIGVATKSLVNLDAYHPRSDKYYIPKKPYKVFFYARPNMPRNAFELGISALKKLKNGLGEDVEIITAGAAWDAGAYGVEGMFTNLGLIAYNAVPRLYRSVDAGLMFMFSGHPGVTASELMASGCPVVVNQYDDSTWHELYQHERTCLVATTTASEVARNLQRCLTDQSLRKTLIDGGLAKVKDFYGGYEASIKQAYSEICSPKDRSNYE